MALNDDCLFCKIIKGDIPALKVWEDAHALAFLDINPLARGHTLVIPRDHVAGVHELTPDQAGALGRAVTEVTARVQKALGAPASSIGINNGEDAGQEVPHVHVHVVPRASGDGVGPFHALFQGHAPDVGKDELAKIQAQIRDA